MAQIYGTQLLPSVRFSPPASPIESQANHEISFSPTRIIQSVQTQPPTLDSILTAGELTAFQRDVAVRISQAAETLRAWHEQLQGWSWTGNFARDGADIQILSNAFSTDLSSSEDNFAIIQQQIVMPLELVIANSKRLEKIYDDLSNLDLESLKAYIFGLHMDQSRPIMNVASSTGSLLHFLDDYTFFVTQTLVQVLPIMSSLPQDLAIWTARLSVVQQSFDYLHEFCDAASKMKNAWLLLSTSASAVNATTDGNLELGLLTAKTECHASFTAAATLLDGMLDMLEGQVDTLPGTWIDAFEELEAEFGDWCTSVHKFLFWHTNQEYNLGVLISDLASASDDNDTKDVEGAGHVAASIAQPLPKIEPLDVVAAQTVVSATHNPSLAGKSIYQEPLAEIDAHAAYRYGASSMALSDDVKHLENLGPVPSGEGHGFASNNFGGTEAIIKDESTSTSFSADQIADSIEDPAEMKRCSDTSDYSKKFSDQSLLANSVFSEQPAADLTDLTDVHTDVDNTAASSLLERPRTPDFGYCSDDDAFLEDLAGLSVHSEPEDDSMISDMDDSPLRHKQPLAMAPKPPLNAIMKKRLNRAANPAIITSDADETQRNSQMTPKSTPKERSAAAAASSVSPSMPLELQISSILEAIPTPIRFRSGPKANAPDFKQNRKRTDSASHDWRSAATSRSSTPALTLAPAEESSRRKASGSSEIRLYHLIQSGQEKPIKLFIRRVGENGERVMVRVGGGWADLGEYLRIYAEHHGRRTTSEGRIEMQAMKLPKTGSTPKRSGSRRSSLLGTAMRSMTPTLGRASTPTIGDKLSQSGGKLAIAATSDESKDTAPQSAASTESRRASGWNEVGMSGPRTRRVETSGEKKEWIDGIVEQAKRDFGQHVSVGDLGKSGSTRRIFFKGRNASGST